MPSHLDPACHRGIHIPCTLFVLAIFAASTAFGTAAGQAAQQPPLGKFDHALDIRHTPVRTKSLDQYRRFPLTVEMWVHLSGEKLHRDNVLVSNLPGSPQGHWEIYTTPLDGFLTATLSGVEPTTCATYVRITDDQWHYVALTCDGRQIALYLDGKQVGRQAITIVAAEPAIDGELFVGAEVERAETLKHPALVDELRISNTVRKIDGVPRSRFESDERTIGLWRFDETGGTRRSDLSSLANSLTYSPGIESAWTPLSSTRPDADPWERETDDDWKDTRFDAMDKGHYLGLSMAVPPALKLRSAAYAAKGLAVRVGEQGEACVLYDRGLLQMSAAWAVPDGRSFVQIPEARFGLIQHPQPIGETIFATRRAPGWQAPLPSFDLRPWQPLPKTWGRYSGHYVHGPHTILSYTVVDTPVLELPWAVRDGDVLAVTRTFEFPEGSHSLVLQLSSGLNFKLRSTGDPQVLVARNADDVVAITAIGSEPWVRLQVWQGQALLRIPQTRAGAHVRVAYWRGPAKSLDDFVVAIERAPLLPASLRTGPDNAEIALRDLVAGGAHAESYPRRWTATITTEGQLATDTDRALAVDTLNLPYDDPYGSIFYVTGVGFLPDGAVAISTIYGDVWLARFDDQLRTIDWNRFASGMYQPLGLVVRGGDIFVLERGQITRLVDLNGDDEADYYENFYNGWETTGSGHAYDTALKLAPDGSFFLFKGQVSGNEPCAESGCLLRVAADGSKHEIYSTGFRHPIGLGMNPDGVVTGGDQQGNWMPATRIDRYQRGGFYGDMRTHHRATPPTAFDPPLCWLPHAVDNSAGGQLWVPRGAWGPLGGLPLHLSWGRCRLNLLFMEQVGGHWQGGVVPLPCDTFLSGTITGAFRPDDGHLYVVGLHGWQTAGEKDGCLQRVRYTGRPLHIPVAVRTHADGLAVTFSEPLDRATAEDPARYQVEQWNYRYSGSYGSDHWSINNPDQMGHDLVAVDSASLSPDGRTLSLKFANQPVMQLKLAYDLLAADGAPIKNELHYTIHAVPSAVAMD